MNNIFDSHAHYDDERFGRDRETVLAELPGKGVVGVMNAACSLDSALECIKIAGRYDYIYASAGVHPHEAKSAPRDLENRLCELLRHPKVKAIGEAGLDYHYDFSPRDIQLKVFEIQIKTALKLDVPMIIHDREAHADTLSLLKRYKPRGIMHCYSGSAEMAEELLELGFYIGFTGVVTFKNARKTLEAVKSVPMEKLLIETDCPYMAPEPYRGSRCDSSMLVYTAEAIAKIKNIALHELLDMTCENARTVYEIL